MSIGELRRSVEGVSFDELPMPDLSIDDLDIAAAQEAFGDSRKLDEHTLTTLKLLASHQNRPVPTKGGFCSLAGNARSIFQMHGFNAAVSSAPRKSTSSIISILTYHCRRPLTRSCCF